MRLYTGPDPHKSASSVYALAGPTSAEGVGLLNSFGEVRSGGATPPGAVDPKPYRPHDTVAPDSRRSLDGSTTSTLAPLALLSGRPSAGGAEGSAGGAGPSVSQAGTALDPLRLTPPADRYAEKNTGTGSHPVPAEWAAGTDRKQA